MLTASVAGEQVREVQGIDLVTETVRSALLQMLENGFELPFHAAMVGCNGAFVMTTYVSRPDGSGLDATLHYSEPNKPFAVPVNMMVVDSRGEAVRVLIEKNAPPTMLS